MRASHLNPVNHPTSCLGINCLQFIRGTVSRRLYKRPSARTIIRGRLPPHECPGKDNCVSDETRIQHRRRVRRGENAVAESIRGYSWTNFWLMTPPRTCLCVICIYIYIRESKNSGKERRSRREEAVPRDVGTTS